MLAIPWSYSVPVQFMLANKKNAKFTELPSKMPGFVFLSRKSDFIFLAPLQS